MLHNNEVIQLPGCDKWRDDHDVFLSLIVTLLHQGSTPDQIIRAFSDFLRDSDEPTPA